MDTNMIIERIKTADLADIVAGLVAKGVTFKAYPMIDYADRWVVELTGGY